MGLTAERGLHEAGGSADGRPPWLQAAGTTEGRYCEDDAYERIKIETRRFAKNQRTWLRRLQTTPGTLTLRPEEQDPAQMAQIIVNKVLTDDETRPIRAVVKYSGQASFDNRWRGPFPPTDRVRRGRAPLRSTGHAHGEEDDQKSTKKATTKATTKKASPAKRAGRRSAVGGARARAGPRRATPAARARSSSNLGQGQDHQQVPGPSTSCQCRACAGSAQQALGQAARAGRGPGEEVHTFLRGCSRAKRRW